MKHFYFPFYTKEFISSTLGMRAEQIGIYTLFMCYQHDNGALPIDDMEEIMTIARSTNEEYVRKVLRKFPEGINKKLEEVKNEGMRISGLRQEAGSMGAQAKLKQTPSKTQANAKQNSSKLSDSNINSNSELKSELKSNTYININNKDNVGLQPTTCFDEIWSLYPNKDGKKAAERSFRASVTTDKDYEDIMTALHNYLGSEKVQKGFIKNGSTWFNNWRDWVDYKPITAGMRTLAAAQNLQNTLERTLGNE